MLTPPPFRTMSIVGFFLMASLTLFGIWHYPHVWYRDLYFSRAGFEYGGARQQLLRRENRKKLRRTVSSLRPTYFLFQNNEK